MLIRSVELLQPSATDPVTDILILCSSYWLPLICTLGMMINIALVIKLHPNDLLIINKLTFQHGLNLGNLILKAAGPTTDFKYLWPLYY